jgi:hypothetical protein
MEKQKQLEMEKRNRIWVAGLWKKHQLECLKNIFSKEKQSVEDDYKVVLSAFARLWIINSQGLFV